MGDFSAPFSRVIEAVARIAAKFDVAVKNTGNRLADNLEAIADADIGGGGSGGGILIVHAAQSSGERPKIQLDKTAGELEDAFLAGKNIYLTKTDVMGFPWNYQVVKIGAAEDPEYGYGFQVEFDTVYVAQSRDAYPVGGDR